MKLTINNHLIFGSCNCHFLLRFILGSKSKWREVGDGKNNKVKTHTEISFLPKLNATVNRQMKAENYVSQVDFS